MMAIEMKNGKVFFHSPLSFHYPTIDVDDDDDNLSSPLCLHLKHDNVYIHNIHIIMTIQVIHKFCFIFQED